MNAIIHENTRNGTRNYTKVFLISCLFVFLFALFSVEPVRAAGASLYFSPAAGTFFVGSTFDVSVFVNTGGEDVNAVEINIKFDPTKFQIASPTAGKSFIEVWVAQPTYSNVKGEMNFIGGVPTPGINTSAGLVSTVTFRAISPGETTVLFLASSKVLRNDPDGTNILTSTGRGVYNLGIPPPEGPKIFSTTHPDTNKWYKDNNPTFCWEKEEGVGDELRSSSPFASARVTDFSYSFDQDPEGIPDNVSEGDYTCISYSQVKDGIWYFHVKAKKAEVWGGTSHYLVQIDATPPAAFTPTVEPSPKTIEKQPLVSFITTDALSGINYYQLKYIDITPGKKEEEVGFFREVISPYKLPSLEVGKYLVVVRAYDIAGNFREGTVKIQILPGKIIFTKKGIQFREIIIPWWVLILILIIILLSITFYIWKKYQSRIEEERKKISKIEIKLKNHQKKILDGITKIR